MEKIELHKICSLQESEYVKILSNNVPSFGGNQGWFTDNKKISKGGCGLIAVCDMLLYFAMTNEKYYTPFLKRNIPDLSNITRQDYVHYVTSFNKICLGLRSSMGLSGIALALGVEAYAKGYNLSMRAKWNLALGGDITREISLMINHNIPAILSIGPSITRKKECGVTLYHYHEKKGFFTLTIGKINAHYVVVTAIYTTNDPSHRLMFEVSSWGSKYYIDYDEYIIWAKRLPFFEILSNVLIVKKA